MARIVLTGSVSMLCLSDRFSANIRYIYMQLFAVLFSLTQTAGCSLNHSAEVTAVKQPVEGKPFPTQVRKRYSLEAGRYCESVSYPEEKNANRIFEEAKEANLASLLAPYRREKDVDRICAPENAQNETAVRADHLFSLRNHEGALLGVGSIASPRSEREVGNIPGMAQISSLRLMREDAGWLRKDIWDLGYCLMHVLNMSPDSDPQRARLTLSSTVSRLHIGIDNENTSIAKALVEATVRYRQLMSRRNLPSGETRYLNGFKSTEVVTNSHTHLIWGDGCNFEDPYLTPGYLQAIQSSDEFYNLAPPGFLGQGMEAVAFASSREGEERVIQFSKSRKQSSWDKQQALLEVAGADWPISPLEVEEVGETFKARCAYSERYLAETKNRRNERFLEALQKLPASARDKASEDVRTFITLAFRTDDSTMPTDPGIGLFHDGRLLIADTKGRFGQRWGSRHSASIEIVRRVIGYISCQIQKCLALQDDGIDALCDPLVDNSGQYWCSEGED